MQHFVSNRSEDSTIDGNIWGHCEVNSVLVLQMLCQMSRRFNVFVDSSSLTSSWTPTSLVAVKGVESTCHFLSLSPGHSRPLHCQHELPIKEKLFYMPEHLLVMCIGP